MWMEEDQLFTPPLSSGCVDSTMKNALKEMLQTKGKVLIEKPCQVSNLQAAQEVWLLNATRGIQAVEQFQGISYSHEIAVETGRDLEDFLSK